MKTKQCDTIARNSHFSPFSLPFGLIWDSRDGTHNIFILYFANTGARYSPSKCESMLNSFMFEAKDTVSSYTNSEENLCNFMKDALIVVTIELSVLVQILTPIITK